MNFVFITINIENMELALPFVSDFGHGDNSYLVALTYNLVVRKRVDMVEHKAGRGFFNSEVVAKSIDGFDPSSLFFVSDLARYVTYEI